MESVNQHPTVLNLRTLSDCWVDDGGGGWPLSVNDQEYANAYTASLYCTYVRYLSKELGPLPKTAQAGVRALLGGLGSLLRWGKVDRVVQFNNWLLSTNPVPAVPPFPVLDMRESLNQRYPGHALVWRSLNRTFHGHLLEALRQDGWLLIPSRLVYLFDGQRGDFLKKRDVKNDRKLLMDNQFVWTRPESDADYAAVAELYDQLYRQKYPEENPQFSAQFFRIAVERWGWEILLLCDTSGEPVGVTGWWERHGTLTGTLVGYRLDLPVSLGLYRRLMIRVLLEAAERKLWLNMSSGAGAFKRSRGGQGTEEFMAVYCRHLGGRRQLPYRLLAGLLGVMGRPLLRRYA